MAKRIKAYRAYMESLLQKDGLNWEEIKQEHLTQIAFFQHERLIHLLVTLAFALLEIIVLVATIQGFTVGLFLLAIALMVLLIPYIKHYYLLENEVQEMYRQYDKLMGKMGVFFKETM